MAGQGAQAGGLYPGQEAGTAAHYRASRGVSIVFKALFSLLIMSKVAETACPTSILILVVHGGSILDSHTEPAVRKSDVTTLRGAFESIMRQHYQVHYILERRILYTHKISVAGWTRGCQVCAMSRHLWASSLRPLSPLSLPSPGPRLQ